MDYKMRLQNELRLMLKRTQKRYQDYQKYIEKEGKVNAEDFSDTEKQCLTILNTRIAVIEHIQNLVDRLN